MKTSVYSFYSESKRAFAQVKAQSKKNVVIYAREIMNENIKSSDISKLNTTNSHQSPVEIEHPDIF